MFFLCVIQCLPCELRLSFSFFFTQSDSGESQENTEFLYLCIAIDKRMQMRKRLPGWLKMQRASGENYSRVKRLVVNNHLNTICTSGNCPNIGECWNAGTATFMILGEICTRACKFCNTRTGKPLPPDPGEPQRLAESIRTLGLKHCVITSVNRDDLPD